MSGSRDELGALRNEIDDIDKAIVELLAKRMAACRSIAEVKARSKSNVIQPERVRNVLVSRRQWAIDEAIDADFAEQMFRVILAETHRIEVAHERGDTAPKKDADTLTSALDTVAVCIDHVVVAVANLDTAAQFLATLGFRVEPSSDPDIRVADAGGVTVVLVGPGDDPAVRKHLEEHGSGVQHIAIEVLNAGFVQAALAEAGIPLLTDVLVDAAGHEQLFTVKDPATGVQIGFISRTGHREAISGHNVRALFRALDGL
jgi:chorismate mutase-like protein